MIAVAIVAVVMKGATWIGRLRSWSGYQASRASRFRLEADIHAMYARKYSEMAEARLKPGCRPFRSHWNAPLFPSDAGLEPPVDSDPDPVRDAAKLRSLAARELERERYFNTFAKNCERSAARPWLPVPPDPPEPK